MNKTTFLRLTITCMLVLAVFYGCQKTDFKDPARKCRIIETSGRTFQYTAWGAPSVVTFKVDPDATGRPTFYFNYDNSHRLISYGGGSNHYLTYNSKGQAVIDTLIMNYAGQDDRYERKLSYDGYGRISKVVQKQYHTGDPDPDRPPVFVEEVTNYNYDARGNLILEGVQYDNKTSLYRTNEVWMFVHQNYSVNNPAGPTTYNAAGLPSNFYGYFLEGAPTTGIIYDCGPTNTK